MTASAPFRACPRLVGVLADSAVERCEICRRPTVACVCDRVVELETSRRVLVLQHPQEQDELLGSAQLLAACLPRARIVVGLSWRNLAHALGEDAVDVRKWAVLFPDREGTGNQVAARSGGLVDAGGLEGIIALDGTWSKAKTLWWRNPWLTKLNRITIAPTQPSIYGRLRTEPRRGYVSTLESVAAALTMCGESSDTERALHRVFRTLVQRVRDANIPKEARKLPTVRRNRPRPSVSNAPVGSDDES